MTYLEETVNAIMMLYNKTRSMVRSSDRYTPFFEITTGVTGRQISTMYYDYNHYNLPRL